MQAFFDQLIFWCGNFIAILDSHAGAISGAATVVIAGFTIALAISTRRLWNEAKTASRIALRSVRAATRSAKAAEIAARAAQYSADAAKSEFIASHRPKLRIRNVDVHQVLAGDILPNGSKPPALPVGPIFKPGDRVTGQLYISNVGDSAATVTEIGCWVKWMQSSLPMNRPYEGEDGNSDADVVGREMAAGQTAPIHFMSDTPMGAEGPLVRQYSDGWHIYVMGWVEYLDKLGTRRRTAFCREYRMPEGRFFAVSDPDYEHEE